VLKFCRRGSNPGGGEIFCTCPDRPWGPPSLLYNGYRVFPGGKVRPGRAADHSPPSSAVVMEEESYTSTHPLGHTGPVTGLPLPLPSLRFYKIIQPSGYTLNGHRKYINNQVIFMYLFIFYCNKNM
jgi:hypothetical protein